METGLFHRLQCFCCKESWRTHSRAAASYGTNRGWERPLECVSSLQGKGRHGALQNGKLLGPLRARSLIVRKQFLVSLRPANPFPSPQNCTPQRHLLEGSWNCHGLGHLNVHPPPQSLGDYCPCFPLSAFLSIHLFIMQKRNRMVLLGRKLMRIFTQK